MVNQQLRQVEGARRRIAAGDADVLMLGDSSCLFRSPDDQDRAMIPELISRELGGARVVTVAAPGFGGHVFGEIVRFLGTLDRRPSAVVVATTIRCNAMTHVVDHPVFRYRRTTEMLAQREDARRRLRSLLRGSHTTPREYEAFETLEVRSRWTGHTTIGEYRRRLRGQIKYPMPPDTARLLFDYYHGELLTDEHWGLSAVAKFAEQMRAYAVPAVACWTAPPLMSGETLFPGEFTAHVRDNLTMLQSALGGTDDRAPTFIDLDFGADDFVNPLDGTEHYSFSGRSKIAAAAAAALSGVR